MNESTEQSQANGAAETESPEPRTLDGLCLLGFPVLHAERLAGDASVRRFHRIGVEGRDQKFVLMETGEAFDEQTDPFIRTAGFFRSLGLPVPDIVIFSGECGFVLMEDLGDTTLERFVMVAEPGDAGRVESLYIEALEIVHSIQHRATPHVTPDLPGGRLAFDFEKLRSELEFFHRHFFGSLSRADLSSREEGLLHEFYHSVSSEVSGYRPQVLCHRDFHSRNLMVTPRGLVMVDFQDARLGPCTYDYVSLLRDSYIRLDPGLEKKLNGMASRFMGEGADSRCFEMTALQRNIKAVGTFAYQVGVCGKVRYAESIPVTWSHLDRALAELPEFTAIREVLARHIGTWAVEDGSSGSELPRFPQSPE